jgi:hypothetical protein
MHNLRREKGQDPGQILQTEISEDEKIQHNHQVSPMLHSHLAPGHRHRILSEW